MKPIRTPLFSKRMINRPLRGDGRVAGATGVHRRTARLVTIRVAAVVVATAGPPSDSPKNADHRRMQALSTLEEAR
jgi:succinate dehydrogenase/fumarate reductase flavoprotein subunit